MGFGPIFDLAHFNFGPYRNLAHFGPSLRKSGGATGQAALPIPTPLNSRQVAA